MKFKSFNIANIFKEILNEDKVYHFVYARVCVASILCTHVLRQCGASGQKLHQGLKPKKIVFIQNT